MRSQLAAGAVAGLMIAALTGVSGPALRFDAPIPDPILIGPDDASLPTLNLVVLGDSYASAALPFDRGTLQVLGAPSVCARGPAWPRLLMPTSVRLSLTHVSCSGAVVADLVDRRMRAGETLQVQALSADTDIVMLGIGGNDAGFSEVFAACRTEVAADCVAAGARMKPQAAALSGTLVSLYRTVLERAPNAVVIVVMYADSLPVAGTPGLDACTALRAPGDSISDEDLVVLNEWGSDIADRVRGAVATVGDPRLRVADLADAFLGHRLCDPDPYQWGRDGEIPFHPNTAGHAALAARLSTVLDTLVTQGAAAHR
jgi:lysophospholipase L1-like esterase